MIYAQIRKLLIVLQLILLLKQLGLYLYKEGGTFEKVDAGNIIRNEPSCIEFILPSTVQVGSLYSIKVRNQGKTRNGFTKAVREGSAGTLVKIIV